MSLENVKNQDSIEQSLLELAKAIVEDAGCGGECRHIPHGVLMSLREAIAKADLDEVLDAPSKSAAEPTLLQALEHIIETAAAGWNLADTKKRVSDANGFGELRDICQAIDRQARAAIARAEPSDH